MEDPLNNLEWTKLAVDPELARLRDEQCKTCNGRGIVAYLRQTAVARVVKTNTLTWWWKKTRKRLTPRIERHVEPCRCTGRGTKP